MRAATALLLSLAALLAAPAARAHDSWFTALPSTARGQLVLALGTGTRYPGYQLPVAPEQLASSGCVGDGVREVPLRDGAELSFDGLRQWLKAPPVLMLRTGRPVSPAASVSCWARLVPIEIDIDDPTVDIYLDEIRPSPAMRARWAALKARGVRWQETYVKHARIEIDGEEAAGRAAEALPELGLDARLRNARRPLRAGDTLQVQLLRDGRPLAGMSVQLRRDGDDGVAADAWQVSDADGRIAAPLDAAGRWILRGVDLRAAADGSDRWDSRFLTLAFEVKPKAP